MCINQDKSLYYSYRDGPGEFIRAWKVYLVIAPKFSNTWRHSPPGIYSTIFGHKPLDLTTNLIVAHREHTTSSDHEAPTNAGIYAYLDKQDAINRSHLSCGKRIVVEVLGPRKALTAVGRIPYLVGFPLTAVFNYLYLTDRSWDKLLRATDHELTPIRRA